MTKTRVREGDIYFYIWTDCYFNLETRYTNDARNKQNDDDFEKGNYFLTNDEAVEAITKLRAVLKGADVIEMPSGEDFMKAEKERFRKSGFSDSFDPYDIFYGGFVDCYDFLKSKIVK